MLIEINRAEDHGHEAAKKAIDILEVYFFLTRQDAIHIIKFCVERGRSVIPKAASTRDLNQIQRLLEGTGFIAKVHVKT